MEAFDLEFDDDEYFLDFANNQLAATTKTKQSKEVVVEELEGNEKEVEQAHQQSRSRKDNDAAQNSTQAKEGKLREGKIFKELTLNNLHQENLKEAEKTKSSTPITKNNSKNTSVVHSNSKMGPSELTDGVHGSSASKDRHAGSRYQDGRRYGGSLASPDDCNSPLDNKGTRTNAGRLLGKRENNERE